MIVWYVLTRDEPFAWDRPALTAHKLRALELQAGMPAQHGSRKGSAAAYSLKSVRQQERAVAEQSERTYQRLFNRWKQSRPKSDCAPIRWPEARTFESGRARSVGLGPVFELIPLHEWRTNR